MTSLLLGGGLLVAALGGLGGFLALGPSDLASDVTRKAAVQPPPGGRDAGPGMVVEVVASPPPPTPRSTTLLEVLSAKPTAPAAVMRSAAGPASRPNGPTVTAPVGDHIPTASAEVRERALEPACHGSPAERMVCGDTALREADDRLQLAYEDAISAGVPERVLQDEQADWRAIREDAAVHSREAVASIYQQRIRELQMMAEETFPANSP